MRAEHAPREEASSREPLRRALGALATGVLIGGVGGFATPQVWVVALAGGLASYAVARRSRDEVGTDPSATLLNVAFVVVLCAAAWDSRTATPEPLYTSPLAVAGLATIVAGLELRRRAVAALGPYFSMKLQLRRDHRLVDRGPYRLLRHPNYAGLVLVMIGTALVLHSPLALGAFLLVWLPALLLRIGREESILREHLGEDYVRYSERTWRLVPGLY